MSQIDIAAALREKEREEDRIFQRTMHEDTLFNGRLNFFLVFESLLIAAGAALFAAGVRPHPWVFVGLAVFGIIVTWLWRYTQLRQLTLLRALIDELEEFAAEVKRVERRARGKVEHGMRTGSVLAVWVPWLVLALWVAILIAALSEIR